MAGRKLTFNQLDNYPVMAQALDNQWLPNDLIGTRQLPEAGVGRFEDGESAAAAELRRALVNSGTLVVNRAYLLNNRALYSNFAPTTPPAERDAFASLLNDGSLVPYLYTERDPAADFGWSYNRAVHTDWQRLLADEAGPDLVRLDWDDRANLHEAGKVRTYFGRQLVGLRYLQVSDLARDLGVTEETARALRDGIVTDICRWANEQDVETGVTRERVYKEFLTRPGTEVRHGLLREGEQVVLAKQLIDLVYSLGVPDVGNIIALTPPGSPPRSALQELLPSHAQVSSPEDIGLLLRGIFSDALHRAVDGPNSYGSLSLADIVTLRGTRQWEEYKNGLESFVTGDLTADGGLISADEFHARTVEVARLHRTMLRTARKVSRGQRGFQRELKIALILESAGISMQLTAGEEVSLVAGSIQVLAAGAGAVSLRLELSEAGRGSERGGLGHSMTLRPLKLGNLRRDWQEIIAAYGGRIAETGRPPRRGQADQQSPDA